MPNWKKLLVSGSDANLNSLNVTTSITGSDVKIDDWGSISGSLANLTDTTPDGSGTTNYITKWSDSDTLTNSTVYDNGGIVTIGSTQQGWSGNKLNVGSTSDGAAGMNILTSATGNAYIIFSDAVDGSSSEYANQIRYSHTDNFLAIQTEGTERLRIKSGGNVGIGTSDPALRLHVHGTARATNLLLGDSSTANTPTIPLFIKSSGTNARMRIEDSDGANTSYDFLVNQGAGLSIIEGSTTRMHIKEGGNVGIGTTNPTTKLHVSAASSNSQLTLERTGTATGKYSIYTNTNNLVVQNVASNTYPLTILNSGKVGIGTLTPAEKLTVKDGSIISTDATGTNYAKIDRFSGLTLKGNGAGTRGIQTPNTDALTLGTNNTERMRILATGNVGIGTTTPSAKLEVYSSGSTVFEVNGSQGQLFSITDSLSGSLFSVSDISGTPLLEVESDSTITLGDYNTNTLVVTGSLVGIGKGDPDYKFHVKDNQDSSLQSGIVVERSVNTQKAYFNVVGGAANLVADTNIPIKVRHGSTTRLEINTSGNSTFSGNLTTTGDFAAEDNIYLTDAGTVRAKLLLNASDRDNVELRAESLGSTMKFFTVGTEALLLDASQNATFAGDVTVAGTLTAQEFHTELVSASIVYESGSTKFGNTVDDNHDFTGSLNILAQSGASGIQLDRGANTYININNSSTRNEFNFKSTAGLRFYHGTDSTSPLFISSSGNVGIGTTSPLSRLTVAGGTGTTYNDGTLQVVGTIAMVSTSNLNAALNRWVLRPRAAGVDGSFDIYDARHSLTRLAINNTGKLTLPAYGSGTHTGTLASTLGVDSSGNVIEFTGGGGGSVSAITSGADTRVAYFNGTDSLEGSANFTWDDNKLQINKATIGEYLRVGSGGLRELRFSTYNTTSDHAGHKIDASSSNGEIALATGGTARMYIGSTGNVGIGMSPSTTKKLAVNGSATVGGEMFFTHFDNISGSSRMRDNLSLYFGTNRKFGIKYDSTADQMQFISGSNVNMSIEPNGNIGIGNTAPPVKFTVNNGIVRTNTAKTYSTFIHTNDTDDYRVGLATAIKGGATAADRYVSIEASSYQLSTDTFTNEFDLILNPVAGNVGIGTTNPTSHLDVFDSTLSTLTLSYPGGGNNGSAINFSLINAAVSQPITTQIKAIDDGVFRQNLSFLTKTSATGSSGLTERMRITGAGNVGIGTTSPGNFNGLTFPTPILDVAGPVQSRTGNIALGGTTYRKAALMTSTGTDAPYLDLRVASSGTSSSTTARMRIDSSGNVGIGTTSPTRTLSVEGTAFVRDDLAITVTNPGTNLTKDSQLYLQSKGNQAGNVRSSQWFIQTESDSYWGNSGFSISKNYDGGSAVEYLRILSNGNVGIGTTNPVQKLQVNGSVYSNGGEFFVNGDKGITAVGSLIFKGHDGTNYFEGMRLHSDGNVGIGTTNPSSKLSIRKDGAQLSIQRADSTGTEWKFYSWTDGLNIYPAAAKDIFIGRDGASTNLQLHNGILKVLGTGDSYFTGNVGIGTSSPGYKLDVNGDIQNNGVLRRGGNVYIKSTGSDTAIGPAGAGTITFHTSSVLTGAAEAMRIDADGNLLLNNTSAGARLDIREDTNYAIRAEDATGHYFRVNTGGDVDMRGDLVVQGTITAQQFHSEFVSASIIYDSGSTKFGDTSDDNHDFTGSLNLLGSAEITGDIQLVNKSDALIFGSAGSNGTWGAPKIGRIDSNLIISDYSGVQLGGYSGSAYGPRMTVKGTGNVGIGTTSPVAKLHIDVVSEDNQPGFKLTKVSDQGENAMEVHHGTSSALRGIADFTNSNGSVLFLRGDGNVGIGTTAPKQLFHVHGGSTSGSVTKAVIGGTGGNGESHLYLAENFSGDNVSFGFSFVADGNSSNNLLIKRHSGNTSGVTVLTINRDNSDATFAGALQVNANLDVNGTSLTLSSAAITYQNNNDVDTGTETIATVVKANHDAAFFDYVVKNGTNLRAGTVMAVHDGTNVEFTDNSTKDIGDTSGVTFSVDISGTDLRLRATTTSDNWIIKTLVKSI